jgi:hypothetical protein
MGFSPHPVESMFCSCFPHRLVSLPASALLCQVYPAPWSLLVWQPLLRPGAPSAALVLTGGAACVQAVGPGPAAVHPLVRGAHRLRVGARSQLRI